MTARLQVPEDLARSTAEGVGIPPGYRLAMGCDPDLAIAIAIANQDHGLDGYVGEAWILILILAIARSTSMCS